MNIVIQSERIYYLTALNLPSLRSKFPVSILKADLIIVKTKLIIRIEPERERILSDSNIILELFHPPCFIMNYFIFRYFLLV